MSAAIPDTDHVSRYCSPYFVQNDKISPGAFYFKDNDYISVNWLEYLGKRDIASAVRVVRGVLDRKITMRRNGRIVVLNVGAVRDAVYGAIGIVPRIEHMPSYNDESHAGIFRYDMTGAGASQAGAKNDYANERPAAPEKKAALRLALLVGDGDVYTAVDRSAVR